MAAIFAELARLSLITYLLTLHLLSSTATPSAPNSSATKSNRFVTKVIHRDSAWSPYYNPDERITDHVSSSVKSSLARFKYLEAKSTKAINLDDTRAGLVAENSATQFMANFSFGEPPVPQLLTIDTGSNLLWIQCLPCTKCFEQSSPIFDPAKSSTYKTMPCTSPNCTVSPTDMCDASNNCKFSHNYLDGTAVAGLLATEKLTFETSDEGLSPVNDAIFGCAHDNDGYNGQPSGILGLGPSQISLATYLGSKFAYCIGSIRDPKYPHNHLIMGDGTETEGSPTPLEVYNDLYYLTIEGISLGQTLLPIDKQVFVRKQSGKSGTVIDSGTTLSFLTKPAYDVLSGAVQKLADPLLERVHEPSNPSALCYKGIIDIDLRSFPDVVFHLAGEVDLALDIMSLFEESGQNEFCMAVQMSPEGHDLNIIGIMAQQGYYVVYDVAARQVYFQEIDCELLDSSK